MVALKSDGLKESTWQYRGQRIDDWEKDLVADDDDKLPETLKKYSRDENVKGSRIVPTPQSNSDFAEDYPKDEEDQTGPLESASERSEESENADAKQASRRRRRTAANSTTSNSTHQTADSNTTGASPDERTQADGKQMVQAAIQAAQKAVEAETKELEKAKKKASHAHESVVKQKEKIKGQEEAIAEAEGNIQHTTEAVLKCHKVKGKLETDLDIAKQAKKAFTARIEMLKKQRSALANKVRHSNDTIAHAEGEANKFKKKLDVATEEQEKLQEKEELAEAAMKNATSILSEKNQSFIEATVAANSTLTERREEANKQAKAKTLTKEE